MNNLFTSLFSPNVASEARHHHDDKDANTNLGLNHPTSELPHFLDHAKDVDVRVSLQDMKGSIQEDVGSRSSDSGTDFQMRESIGKRLQ